MRVITSRLKYSPNKKIVLRFGRYEATRGWAITALDARTNEHIATLTTCLPEQTLAFDEVVIKDYSENEGALRTLVEAGIVKPTGRKTRSGFVTMEIVKLVRTCELCKHFKEWGVASKEPRPAWGKDGVCDIKVPREGDGGASALCVMKADSYNKFLPAGLM